MLSGNAHAALIDRGGGLIYDDVLNVTWLQDANFAKSSGYDSDGLMLWDAAMSWASDLSYYDSVRKVYYSDWRLPSAKPINGSNFNHIQTYDGTSDYGYNIRSAQSELAYMFYVNLGNVGEYTPDGSAIGCFVSSIVTCVANTGPFYNIQPIYWSGAFYPPSEIGVWGFYMSAGAQGLYSKTNPIDPYAWAVRDGDVLQIAEPTTLFLLCVALAGLGFVRRPSQRF